MSVYAFGPYQLDSEQLLLSHEGEPATLGPKVVETLLALVEHPGDVLGKGVLLDRIWPEGFVEEANLSQNIHVLRKTFRGHGVADPIETIPRRGYRFTAAVRRLADVPLAQPPIVPVPIQRPPARASARRIAALVSGSVFLAASLIVVSSSVFSRHYDAPVALSAHGQRLYGVGRYYWNLRTRDSVRRSLSYFAQVVDADPRDARGYAALADANVAMGEYCYGSHDPSVYFARAREYALRALELDPNSAEAHAALGILALEAKQVRVAAAELQRAIALNPRYGPAHEWYGVALLEGGRVSDGVVHLKTAAELDPLSVATTAWLAQAAYRERRFDDAIRYARHALELAPERVEVMATLGEAHEAQGDFGSAIEAFSRYRAVGKYYRPEASALLAHAYALARRMPEARAHLQYARAHAKDVDPLDLAAAAVAVHGGVSRLPNRRTAHASMYA